MMAEKARLFRDAEMRRRIIDAPTLALAKGLGRQVRGLTEVGWKQARYEIVCSGSSHKLDQNHAERAFLIRTHEDVLVEASPSDRIWGIGFRESEDAARGPDRWGGLSLLGFALMNTRSRLRARHR